MVNQYFDEKEYIAALAKSLEDFWGDGPRPERLLFSFHGLPKKNFRQGDPYFYLCHTTARLVAEKLGLADDFWQIAFQSRFGEDEWLNPYTDQTLRDWAASGVKSVDVICPGFAADCLETLEEIVVEYKNVFLNDGGESYRYVPALNATEAHAAALAKICLRRIQDWKS
jgi:ferrochelatase